MESEIKVKLMTAIACAMADYCGVDRTKHLDGFLDGAAFMESFQKQEAAGKTDTEIAEWALAKVKELKVIDYNPKLRKEIRKFGFIPPPRPEDN